MRAAGRRRWCPAAKRIVAAFAVVLSLLPGMRAASGQPRAETAVVDLATRPGVTLRLALLAPAGPPAAAAILLAGSNGAVAVPERVEPGWTRDASILVRTAPALAARGVLVAIADAPSDRHGGLPLTFRGGPAHMADIEAVIAELRRRTALPVWLVGHSSGAISAATAAARLPPPRGPDGIVLVSTVWRPVRPSAGARASEADIRVPVLLAHNRADRCTPLANAEDARRLLVGAPRRELAPFDGASAPGERRCGRYAAHGFYQLEDRLAATIADWIAQR